MSRTSVLFVATACVVIAVAVGVFYLGPALGWRSPQDAPKERDKASSSHAPPGPASGPDVQLPPGVRVHFADVTRAAAIDFRHFDGRTPMQYIMDQTGSGLGWPSRTRRRPASCSATWGTAVSAT
jgi:hypothetical protein